MKYLKYMLVDAKTGLELANPHIAKNGRKHPAIVGLDVKHQMSNNFFFLAQCPDDSEVPEGSGVIELTEEQYNTTVESLFDEVKAAKIKAVYDQAKTLRDELISEWYHPSEITFAAAVKKVEADAAIAAEDDEAADTAAPYLAIEAGYRGITTKELAALVVAKYDDFKAEEARLAGVRGAKVDALSDITFDVDNQDTSFGSLSAVSVDTGWNPE